MRQHAHELHGDRETFYYYREVLEPLFFETMNTKRPGDVTRWNGIRIPYLNGGLFDESRDPAGPIILPDSLFDPNSDEGLLAFFNRYNFTVTDDTPLEQDVAVDPEMLGKVFENMLEERDRGQSGSFYTPRTIVSYMCQEALAGYLEESAGVPRETTRAQFDPDSEVRYTPEEAQRVNTALDTVTALDPAVGSGSFLIGMMNEIIRLRKACYAVLNRDAEVPASMLADWKEAIIRDTLYGVDIKPEAIEIAQLRLWLALVVEQTLEQARPLPNLDYKLMAGNSLIETIDGEPVLSEAAQQMLGADVAPVQSSLGLFETDRERYKLDELRQQFFRAAPEQRRELRQQITAQERRIVATSLRERADALQSTINALGKQAGLMGGRLKAADERRLKTAVGKLERLTRLQEEMAKPDYALPFFLYRLHFSEVFERKGGFDIVIANPPYVRMELIKEQKDEFEEAYNQVFAGRADLYVYFFARAYQLLRERGQLSFITSNKYLRANYGRGLRGFLSEYLSIRALVDFGDLPVFEAAAYPCIFLGWKAKPQSEETISAIAVNEISLLEDLPRTVVSAPLTPQRSLTIDSWNVANPIKQEVLRRLIGGNQTLGTLVKGSFYRGVVTGLNEAFVIDDQVRSSLIAEDAKSVEVIKPFLGGRDVQRWQARNQRKYLIFMPHGIAIQNYPAIKRYLEKFRVQLEGRATSNNHQWYELQQPQMGIYHQFDSPKLIYPDIAVSPRFALDVQGFYFGNTAYALPETDLFLLGILNSTCVSFFYGNLSAQIRGGYYRFFTQYVSQIPIPTPPNMLREQIKVQVRKCLDAAASAPEKLPALEAELNALVYQAYGLNEDDIRVIEGHLTGRDSKNTEAVDETEME